MDDSTQAAAMNRISEESRLIVGVRKRPAMYVASTAFSGFIKYLVGPVALLLGQRPNRLAIAAGEGGFVVEADVALPIEELSSGRFAPFEEILDRGSWHSFEGTVLNALSERLTVEVRQKHRTDTLAFRRGIRESYHASTIKSDSSRTTLRFIPDASVFTVTNVSPTFFLSYLRRLSFLHAGVRFSISIAGETHEFCAVSGIVDFFASASAPYQVLHDPIHIVGDDGNLHLEAIFAYHSWNENGLWCFINNGRAVEGGTHTMGLRDALNRLRQRIKLSKSPLTGRNGVVAVMSVQYPETVWEGCMRTRIGNPELRGMVCNLVVQRATQWLEDHPDVAEQLQKLEPFQFPDPWYR
jgi:DNA gyrase/topoisomerase IV subunit B